MKRGTMALANIPGALIIVWIFFGLSGSCYPVNRGLGTQRQEKDDSLECPSSPDDRDSVHCELIVRSANTPGSPWHEGSCSVNGKSLFQLRNKNQNIPLSKLLMEENATEMCAGLSRSMDDILQLTRDKLLNTEPEQFKTTGNQNLQITMQTQYNQGQLTDAFCNFAIDEQSSFSFHPINSTLTGSGPDASSIMKQWDRELAEGLQKLLKGDFTHCYKKLLTLWRDTPKSTSMSPDINQFPSTTQLPPTSHFPCNEGINPVKNIVPATAAVLLVFAIIIVMICRKKCCTQGEARREKLEQVKLELQSILST